MSVRVLFTDLDGTLLNDAKEVTPGNQAAIDEALAKGHKIVVCTGRPLASARVCAAKAGLDKEGCYVICFNGGQIYDPYHEKTVYGKTFPREIIAPLAGKVQSFFSNDRYQEIVPEGISKGFAVRWFCEYVGVPIENSVAAGDAQNDIEMLKAAHVGAVMCNAYPGIAEYGNYVTEHDNNHDGVAEIIRKFILRED